MSQSKTVTLEPPVIPVEFVQDFFANCGAEVLSDYLLKGKSEPAAEVLCRTIMWANDLKREATEHGGLLTAESNSTAVETMLAGWGAMRVMGCLQ